MGPPITRAIGSKWRFPIEPVKAPVATNYEMPLRRHNAAKIKGRRRGK
jgi:hypothetical protein